MKTKLLTALLAGATFAHAGIDLTPIASHYEVDGTRHANVAFRDGLKRITYTPPRGWHLTGSGPLLRLAPPDTSLTDAIIEAEPADGIAPIAEETKGAWEKRALLTLPDRAANSTVTSIALNPVRICGHETIEITMRYELFSQVFHTRAVFFTRAGELWRWQLTAQAQKFETLWKTFRESLFTIENL